MFFQVKHLEETREYSSNEIDLKPEMLVILK